MPIKAIHQLIKEKNIKFIDLRFTDTRGKEQHVTVWAGDEEAVEDLLTEGKAFDGSSIIKFQTINESDMLLKPHPSTAVLDPFYDEPTLVLRCDLVDPKTLKGDAEILDLLLKKSKNFL